MNQSENIGSLAKALCIVQSQLEGAKKDSVNPFFRSKYADLASVWDACRDLLHKNELAVAQTSSVIEGRDLVVVTTLMHSSGEWIRGELAVPLTKQDPQGIGSAITYARRYALSAIVGISPEDDDAEAATSRPKQPAKTAEKPTKEELEKAIEKTEHWCYHHNVEFFKKGNMKGYAHKTETGWCNEKTDVELGPNTPPDAPQPPLQPVKEESNPVVQNEELHRPTTDRDLSTLKSLTGMQKAVHSDFGVQPADALKILGGHKWTDISDTPEECYNKIQADQNK